MDAICRAMVSLARLGLVPPSSSDWYDADLPQPGAGLERAEDAVPARLGDHLPLRLLPHLEQGVELQVERLGSRPRPLREPGDVRCPLRGRVHALAVGRDAPRAEERLEPALHAGRIDDQDRVRPGELAEQREFPLPLVDAGLDRADAQHLGQAEGVAPAARADNCRRTACGVGVQSDIPVHGRSPFDSGFRVG
jgi:hypothetical protein